MAPQGATLIQHRYKPDANPCTTLKKIIEKVGLKPWPKLLQNPRATRETELLAKYPAKDVTSWLGNSPAIAHKHYAMATDEAFSRAIAETTISTPHRTPQTVQDRAIHDKTGKNSDRDGSAIDAAKGVIRLDLSCLGEEASPTHSYPARTRTLNGWTKTSCVTITPRGRTVRSLATVRFALKRTFFRRWRFVACRFLQRPARCDPISATGCCNTG